MDLLQDKKDLPSCSRFIVWSEFIELTGTTPERVFELIEIGWLEPVRTAENILLFQQRDVYKLRKLERICMDFEIDTLSGSIIIDLLERVDSLEKRVRMLSSLY
ncbi:chaperone modulator CbpM [Lawsonia intracellularis]|uniref:MerR family transcriptional regulator n=1 Tax=Lawsonia intracellularis (strain PHE/MN1-00) TaxID=363253 RepID=Q1MS44_LAWIP|nr:chaperone modulator CbpM [Lawsonia intracellularis]AGC49525.1 hypothetical protein LAW_00124 [Lawsonia intracellularis N343]KAA0205046.1 MerR family transcriptional regulator [Lawsonia intracellularis]MBZ3892428.1 chaperone modulator CbpM [Lawsonia intracellularis]RBN32405.1 MerR family transcriptional regulator [Lawsonia intracellularis]RBN33972.1 MerR family transcriptional regulator [Lawsonia intracellularis]